MANKNDQPIEKNENKTNNTIIEENINPESNQFISANKELNKNNSVFNKRNSTKLLPIVKDEIISNEIVIEDFPISQDSIRIEDREDIIIPLYEGHKNDVALTNDSLPATEDIASNVSSNNEEEFLTPKQVLIKRLNKKLFGTDKTTFGKEEVQKSAELGIAGITGKETTIANNSTDEANYFTFALGGFEFSRKKSK